MLVGSPEWFKEESKSDYNKFYLSPLWQKNRTPVGKPLRQGQTK